MSLLLKGVKVEMPKPDSSLCTERVRIRPGQAVSEDCSTYTTRS